LRARDYYRVVLQRKIELPPVHLYPADEWRIVEARYSDEFVGLTETVFSLGNGFVGVRGSFEEGRPALVPGTFVNGFHETWPIMHAEGAHALARTGQTIVNVPDTTILKLYVDDEPFFLPTARIRDYERVLDMRAGTLTRELVWVTDAGKHVRVRSRRIVSLEYRHLVAMTYEVTMLDRAAPVVISSLVLNRQDAHLSGLPGHSPGDPRLATVLPHRVLNVRAAELADQRVLFGYQTTNSGMTLGIGVDHVIDAACSYRAAGSVDDGTGEVLLTADAVPGVPIRITKYATYQTSRSIPVPELVDRCRRALDRAVPDGFDTLLASQRANLARFWDRADVRVQTRLNPVRQQQAVRWNLFQVAQATWRAEGAGVPAKGLTGQAYEGHYFWDTEVYVLPFLSYTQPRIARNLLRFRHSMLGRARERAAEMSQRGALFPWRTINGEEASSNFQQGTAQYHINADIAYAIGRYTHIQGDIRLLGEIGAEILIETARLWADLGFYGADERFHIHGVTGPDEYTTVVNDNAYTNLMARLNLNFAAATVRRLREERPQDYTALVHTVGLQFREAEAWERAAAAMHIPFDETRRIHPQDETFLDREPWDLDATPREKFPLLLHYHPLVIYRHQVLKQADIVLAMFLLGNEFPEEQKRRNFDYYDPLTTGDSSLSACVQGIIAAEIGRERQALEYFQYALLMDLGNVAGNASDGVHIASAAGVWSSLVFGFGGVRDFDGHLSFTPRLPRAWNELAFSLRFRGRQIRIRLTHDEENYLIDEGTPLEITIRGEPHLLSLGTTVTIKLTPP
jgi:alpha,alpha-trehalose phosphorylase